MTLAAALPTTALAAKPDSKNKVHGAMNGKPFAALYAKLETNTQALGTLTSDMGSLSDELTAVRRDVEAIQYQVIENTAGITELLADMANLETASAATRAEVASLKALYEADIASIEGLIAVLQEQIAESAAEAISLSDMLQVAISDIDALEQISNSTLLEVVSLNATVTSITANIASVESTISDLQARLVTQEDALMNLELKLVAGNAAAMGDFTAITFETLSTDCNAASGRQFNWSINDSVVATSVGGTDASCSCDAGTTSTTVDAASLAGIALNNDGTDTMGFSSPGKSSHYVSWSRAILTDSDGNTESVCLFDEAGGNCSEMNLCTAGFTNLGINANVSF